MKNMLILIFTLSSYSCFASNLSCLEVKAKSAAIAIEQINGFGIVRAKFISNVFDQGLSIATVETYTIKGGALYKVTLEGCEVLKTELYEEVDRY